MTDASGPPFRADHVGSLLRPKNLLDARARHAAGEIDDAELRGIEDEAIADVVRMQADVGLRTATDGEFRRASWHMDFIYAIDGITKVTDQNIVVHFKNADGSHRLHAGRPARRRPAVDRRADLRRGLRLPAVGGGRGADAEADHPLAVDGPLPRRRRSDRSEGLPRRGPVLGGAVGGLRPQVQGIAAQGCTYLQFDDTSLAYLNDPKQRAELAAQGRDAEHLHERYIRQINKALAGRPDALTVTTHMCRGNFRSSWVAEGGYDFVAEALFGGLEVDGFFLEYDDDRSGGFEPLRFVPPGKRVVLGLVTTKRPELERKDDLKRRIDEASRFVPLEQLALSGQCGFSSTVEGNSLTRDEQIAKLALIVETAEEVWG